MKKLLLLLILPLCFFVFSACDDDGDDDGVTTPTTYTVTVTVQQAGTAGQDVAVALSDGDDCLPASINYTLAMLGEMAAGTPDEDTLTISNVPAGDYYICGQIDMGGAHNVSSPLGPDAGDYVIDTSISGGIDALSVPSETDVTISTTPDLYLVTP